MAKQSVNTLKQWFETADKPTQQQFWDWLDSFKHKDDVVAIADVIGLTTALAGKADQSALNAILAVELPVRLVLNADGNYLLPAGFGAYKFLITPTVDTVALYAGTTDGGNDLIYPTEKLTANQDYAMRVDVIARADTTIYFKGIAGTTTILIYRDTLTYQ